MNQPQYKIPSHVAVIMDGNGRWAIQRSLDRIEGHQAGVEALRAVVKTASDSGVKYLTVYAFSTENWGRPVDEVRAIMELLSRVILAEAKDLAENGIALRFIGDIEDLSDDLQRQVEKAEKIEIQGVKMTLNVALNYSARWDIMRAVQRIADMAKNGEVVVDEQLFASQLTTRNLPDVDLVIRTSGEQRLSNFLLWESSYAELYFTETLWPDFGKSEFAEALKWYGERDRRYGVRG